jgi:NADPH:quinone reductase-like Zn-dependent oxidoreductase
MLRVEVSRDAGVVATRTVPLGTPVYPGHEAVGRVIETGPDVRQVVVGQRVRPDSRGFLLGARGGRAVRIATAGAGFALCRRRQEKPPGFVGAGWSGRVSCATSRSCFRSPTRLPDETACLIEPASCSVHAVLRRPPDPGSRVLVVRSGMIGLTLVAALRALNRPAGSRRWPVTISGRARSSARRLATIGPGGAIPTGFGLRSQIERRGSAAEQSLSRGRLDFVYDAVGSARSMHDSIRWCRPRGRGVVLVGVNLFPGCSTGRRCGAARSRSSAPVGHGDDEYEGTRYDVREAVRLDAGGAHRSPGARDPPLPGRPHAGRDRRGRRQAASRAIRVVLDFPLGREAAWVATMSVRISIQHFPEPSRNRSRARSVGPRSRVSIGGRLEPQIRGLDQKPGRAIRRHTRTRAP